MTHTTETRHHQHVVLMLPDRLATADIVDVTRWLSEILAERVGSARVETERREARAAIKRAGVLVSAYDEDRPIGAGTMERGA